MSQLRWLGLLVDARHDNGADLVAPAGGALSSERQALDDGGSARDRYTAEVFGEQSSDGVDILVVELDIEQLSELLHWEPCRHPRRPVGEPLHPRPFDVILVGYLADDLLQDVLDRDDAGGAAVLIDDDHHVDLVDLHLSQHVVDGLGVGYEGRRPHHRLDPLGGFAFVVFVGAARQVLDVDDPDDIILTLTNDRDPREAAAKGERKCLAECLVPFDEDHVGPRNHDLAGDRVTELEDRVHHAAFLGLDEPTLLGQIHQLPKLGLRGERTLAEATPRRQRVAEQNEQAAQRPEHPGQWVEDHRADKGNGVGALATQSAGGDTDHHVGHEDHHHDGEEDGLPGLGKPVQADHRDEDDGGHLAGDPKEQDEVHITRRVGGDVEQPLRGPPIIPGQFLRAYPRDAREGHLDTRKNTGHRDQEY